MKVSIISVNYNNGRYLDKHLSSINAQTYQNWEHILIDGKSSDMSLYVIGRHPDHRRIIISEPDNGIYDAMNKGLSLATGDYLIFLNGDNHFFSDGVLEQFIIAERKLPKQINLHWVVYGDAIIVGEPPVHDVKRYWFSSVLKNLS